MIYFFCCSWLLGGCSNDEKQNQEVEHEHESVEEGTDSTEEHQHHSDIQMELQTGEEIKANQEANLSAHIQTGEGPLTGADVRYEIWKNTNEVHKYIDTKEVGIGDYIGTTTFEESGTYQIKVHVEKEQQQIHDHIETSVEVK